MRAFHFLLLLAAIMLMATIVIADESKAAAKIEVLGGKISRDDKSPGRPVTGIDFRGNSKIRDNDLRLLKAFKNLGALDLTSTSITDNGLKEIGELKGLTSLSLRGTMVTDAGMKELKSLKELLSLNLMGTRVTDDGLQELSELKSLTSLRVSRTPAQSTISLGKSAITTKGLNTLKGSLPNLVIHR